MLAAIVPLGVGGNRCTCAGSYPAGRRRKLPLGIRSETTETTETTIQQPRARRSSHHHRHSLQATGKRFTPSCATPNVTPTCPQTPPPSCSRGRGHLFCYGSRPAGTESRGGEPQKTRWRSTQRTANDGRHSRLLREQAPGRRHPEWGGDGGRWSRHCRGIGSGR